MPANSFYEWQRRDGRDKLPYAISLLNEETFSLAGLDDVWVDPAGRELKTFTILTCEPNELMAPIHDRMPVILRRRDESTWLDPALRQPAPLLRLLVPYPSSLMQAMPISPLVNRPENDTEAVLTPCEEPVPVSLG